MSLNILRSAATRRPAFASTDGSSLLLAKLVSLVEAAQRPEGTGGGLLVITGAGLSTESGIPDYRSPGRPAYTPLQHGEFVKLADVRRRYWARSFTAYDRMLSAQPNRGHRALATLEQMGCIGAGQITQNVDGLLQRAGCDDVLELHGSIHRVGCLACGTDASGLLGRRAYQMMLANANAPWIEMLAELRAKESDAEESERARQRPDFDLDLDHLGVDYGLFNVPDFECADTECDGGVSELHDGVPLMKPSVTFHGGALPKHTSAAALDRVANEASALLVVGSSLTVYSAFRLARLASEKGLPLACISDGPTRADELFDFKVDGVLCGDVLEQLAEAVSKSMAHGAAALNS